MFPIEGRFLFRAFPGQSGSSFIIIFPMSAELPREASIAIIYGFT